MSTLKIHDMKGAAVGDFEMADELLSLGGRGVQTVHDVVLAQLAGRRAGTASVLRKGEVAGSNKKPWKQKGTGRARAGYRQSPIWRGGGVAFGPHPRDYSQKINRKVGRAAFRRILSERIKEGQITLLNELVLSEAKTRAMAALMKSLSIARPALLIVDKWDRNAGRAVRNLAGFEMVTADGVSVYQLMRYTRIVATLAGMEELKKRMAGRGVA